MMFLPLQPWHLTVGVKVPREGVNLPNPLTNGQINKLLTSKWLIVGMIIAPIEQVAPCKLVIVAFV